VCVCVCVCVWHNGSVICSISPSKLKRGPSDTFSVVSAEPGKRVRAIGAYQAADDTELCLQAGDFLVIEEVDGGWWKGLNERTGERGLFPCTYCESLETDTG
jgi:hypothetical protein